MILVVLFLVVVIGVAASKKTSPKSVLQDWFGGIDTTTGSLLSGDVTENFLPNVTGSVVTTGSTTGSLSDTEREETESFIDSLIQ